MEVSMNGILFTALLQLLTTQAPDSKPTDMDVLVVTGTPGTSDYAELYQRCVKKWQEACSSDRIRLTVVGLDEKDKQTSDRDFLESHIRGSQDREVPLWIVLLGHGTYDGRVAKFNLRGPDFSAAELNEWIDGLKRPVIIVNCASCSGAFLPKLAGPNRVVVTATKSGNEHNFTRFGEHFSNAVSDITADYDKDGQVSLLEAYLSASRRVAEFYKSESRLATEHALLDDTGDGMGTPASWFRGIRAIRKPADDGERDGNRAHRWILIPSEREQAIPIELRRKRDALELQVIQLREKKAELNSVEYFAKLEPVLIQLAILNESIDAELEAAGEAAAKPPR